MLAAASLILGEPRVVPALPVTWLAILYLVIATVGAFLLYIFVLGRWTASGASYAFVLTPIVTVVLASLLTDETISLAFLAGALVVIAGVYVGALRPTKKPAAPVEPAVSAEPAMATIAAGPDMEHIQARPGVPTCF
jgi:drug/metabolite transporter (DMT)-like permease